MAIDISVIGSKQAEALLSDSISLLDFDGNLPDDLKLYKLIRARQENPDFEMNLAEFICGEANNSFPYRSSFFLTKFFKDLGFEYAHDGTTRRFWVRDVLLQMTVQELSLVIEKGLFNKREFRKEAKEKFQDFEENYQKAIK